MAAEWLHNQIPETEALVGGALASGALAASSFGAGFGGAVWALVERGRREEFKTEWRRAYNEDYPDLAQAMVLLDEEPGVPAWTSEGGILHGMPSAS